MTDKELLERAAKGVKEVHHCEIWKGESSHFERKGVHWNPLTCDSQAFQLAVELRISVCYDEYDNTVVVYSKGAQNRARVELADVDPSEATRKAIILCAAGQFN